MQQDLPEELVTSLELDVPVPAPDSHDHWSVAASVFLPPRPLERGPVLVLCPGGGYNRRYYDLPADSFSQARHHAARGTVVLALDYLGAGESTVPPFDVSDLATVAAANHAAVRDLVRRLVSGELAHGYAPVEVDAVVGAGQSLGGHAILGTQAQHGTFDAIALMGSSVAGTRFPQRPGSEGTGIDFEWVFHWSDLSAEAAGLVARDVAGGIPARHTPPPWGTGDYPGFSTLGLQNGALAESAASIGVPVLLIAGERDVCCSEEEERAMFAGSPRVWTFTVPRAAHMHNFADTRELVWRRLDELVATLSA